MDPVTSAPAEWAVAARALPGETESGDAHVVVPVGRGALFAVIDALGHGPEAAAAARIAGHSVMEHASLPLDAMVYRCHQQLRSTRGAVMSVALFNASNSTVTWIGIGNVTGHVLRAYDGTRSRGSIVCRGGVVGYQLPAVKPASIAVEPGDTLVLATDGINPAFAEESWHGVPQHIADNILLHHGKASDDALVLVARLYGEIR